jgi:amidophosphoribosyltransferase
VKLYDSLIHLQHRGQDASGILTVDHRFYVKHGTGLVREIFNNDDIARLAGNMGIAHTRYPTAGGYSESDVQPLWIGNPRGIALAHNGNLVNHRELGNAMRLGQHQHLNSSLDSEVLLHLLANELAKINFAGDSQTFFSVLCEAISSLYKTVTGSYSVVSLIIGKGLVAFRDPHGIRPLALAFAHVKMVKKIIFLRQKPLLFMP